MFRDYELEQAAEVAVTLAQPGNDIFRWVLLSASGTDGKRLKGYSLLYIYVVLEDIEEAMRSDGNYKGVSLDKLFDDIFEQYSVPQGTPLSAGRACTFYENVRHTLWNDNPQQAEAFVNGSDATWTDVQRYAMASRHNFLTN